jgi:putative ABC transport system permease protein
VRHTVPRAGLILSDVLAQDLDVKPGDEVQVEVLEGQRVQRSVVVASIMEDVIGSSATMERRALHALVAEGDVLSGAYLRVDPALAPATYSALKELPAIGGVIRRESVMQGFAETIEESFMIAIVVMVAFAVIISAGIIYNGARVALSERGRELASLRVLGFFREEVARLLLGEQALLTVAGIPLGLFLGTGLAWLITVRFDSNLFRIPLVIRPTTVAYSVGLVAMAAVGSALAVRHRVHRLNLIAVLKTRE